MTNSLFARLVSVLFTASVVLFTAQPAAAQNFDVWLVDQSNSAGSTHGGTIHIFDGPSLSGFPAPDVPPVATIDLGGATTTMCVQRQASLRCGRTWCSSTQRMNSRCCHSW